MPERIGQAVAVNSVFKWSIAVTIDISGSVQRVWTVLTNAADFGRWNSTVTSIAGRIALGEKLQANDHGEASTVYHASGGVIANAQVLAGSPGASGQVQFHILVSTPPAADKPVAAK